MYSIYMSIIFLFTHNTQIDTSYCTQAVQECGARWGVASRRWAGGWFDCVVGFGVFPGGGGLVSGFKFSLYLPDCAVTRSEAFLADGCLAGIFHEV